MVLSSHTWPPEYRNTPTFGFTLTYMCVYVHVWRVLVLNRRAVSEEFWCKISGIRMNKYWIIVVRAAGVCVCVCVCVQWSLET